MALHHLHVRKRKARAAVEPYPARSAWKRLLDSTVYAAGIVGPVITLPQVILIYDSKDASGVSAISYFGLAALNIVWILYGFVHREPPIVIMYSLWMVSNLAIAMGSILYG